MVMGRMPSNDPNNIRLRLKILNPRQPSYLTRGEMFDDVICAESKLTRKKFVELRSWVFLA